MSEEVKALEAALGQMEAQRDAAKKELQIYSEMLARVLHETGPVVLKKGDNPDPKAGIDVDFAQDGSHVTISLVVPEGG